MDGRARALSSPVSAADTVDIGLPNNDGDGTADRNLHVQTIIVGSQSIPATARVCHQAHTPRGPAVQIHILKRRARSLAVS